MIACTNKHLTEIGSSWGIRSLSVYYAQMRRLPQTAAAPMMRIVICCRLHPVFVCFVFLHDLRLWLGCGWRLKSTINNNRTSLHALLLKKRNTVLLPCLAVLLVLTCAWSTLFLEVIEISSLLFSHHVASPFLCHTVSVFQTLLWQTGSYRAGKPISLQHFVHTPFFRP